ncbi:MAG: matrixin family metalloprotease [Phycisphaerales bacterium]|nr:matrixin family metalloprotease [Planctomycetota bacterium]MCH8508762.1 matrixin family metalloprotease [Phycisphaerales bacterium]
MKSETSQLVGRLGGLGLIALLAGSAAGADCAADGCTHESHGVPLALVAPDELAQREIARRMLPLMPREHRDAIIAAGGIGSEDHPARGHVHTDACEHVPSDITPREYMEQIFSAELAERMTDIQWQIVNGIVDTLERGEFAPALCFHPDTDPEYAYAVNQLIEFPFTIQFQQTGRWTRTATDGSGLTQGTPTTLTYSFAPDGTFVPNLIGVSGNSSLFAWLNGIYGSPENWKPLFDQVFDRWGELIGTTYVYEPNDDGATLNRTNAAGWGILGVRGDVRIAAIPIDGNGGVLAYNNFPNDGDMVFDAGDSFYNNTNNNSLRMRNIIAHEHGHGLGMLHVCPANQTKLMEPFISTAFDGPQLDDILNGHRHYGDPLEPLTDDPTTAPSLGSFGLGGNTLLTNVSIDGVNDQDFYLVTAQERSRLQVTVAPDAGVYQQGPQTQACNTGTTTNYNNIRDLRIDIYSPNNPFAPLATADDTGLGGTEVLLFDIEEPGDFLVRVSASGPDNVQRYALSLFFTQLPFQAPTLTGDLPEEVDPGVTTDFVVSVDPRDDELAGVPQVFVSIGGAPFIGSDLTSLGGPLYEVSLPAVQCDSSLRFYFSLEGQTSGTVTVPAGGASAAFEAIIGEQVIVFEDDFSTDLGWVVGAPDDDATTGIWERVNPVGTTVGSTQVQPSEPLFGTACYVTGQHPGGGAGANDVDNGKTTLFSPILDLSEVSEPVTISYWRWYSNAAGANPNNDIFEVDISADGGATWTSVEVVGPAGPEVNGGWFQTVFNPADLIPLTDQVRMRFVASDYDPQALVEAAVDGFRVEARVCEDPAPAGCSPADLAEPFGVLNFFDLAAYLELFNAGDPAADFNNDGVLNFFDLSTYLEIFNQGCP